MKSKLLKVGILAAIAALTFCLAGCSSQSETPDNSDTAASEVQTAPEGQSAPEEQVEPKEEAAPVYSVGETVETDIVSFTLDRAELAIALENSMEFGGGKDADGLAAGDYFLPKEYDAQDDASNPFVAAKGHTLVSITFTAECLDRQSVYLDGQFSIEQTNTYAVKYDGKWYTGDGIEVEYGAEKIDEGKWETYDLANIMLSPGERSSYKAYIDIPVEIEDLSSPFEVAFNLPTSSGGRQAFTYAVNQ